MQPLQAAQLALAAGLRRRKLAASVVATGFDKRGRPPATASTKVTPESKIPRSSSTLGEVEPRELFPGLVLEQLNNFSKVR